MVKIRHFDHWDSMNCEVFLIKRFIALILFSAVMLTGCSDDTPDIPSFSFEQSSTVSKRPTTSNSSLQINSSIPESSDTSTNELSSSSEPVISSPEESSVPVSTVQDTYTMVLTYDPRNEKTLKISGDTITVTGSAYDSRITDVYVSPYNGAAVDWNRDGGEFTAEIRLTDFSNSSISVRFEYLNGYEDNVEFKINENGFVTCDLSDNVKLNRKAVEKAIVQPNNQVAEYIVKGGDPAEIRKVMEEIQTLSDQICAGLDNDYDKLRAISRWVSANIYYDYPAFNKGIPAETLSLRYILDRHSSVCGGYSNMTSALCAVQGIKCWNVHGAALTGGRNFAFTDDSEYHEWNFAEIDGRTVWVDSGWNSKCYLYSDGSYSNGGIIYRYFDISEEYLAANHKANYAEYRDYLALIQ